MISANILRLMTLLRRCMFRVITSIIPITEYNFPEKGKRKVQGGPQSQIAALPRPQEEEETDKSKQAQTEQTYEKHKISFLFPKRGNRNTKRTEKHRNKMTHGKTYNKSPRRINHKATKSKTNTGTTGWHKHTWNVNIENNKQTKSEWWNKKYNLGSNISETVLGRGRCFGSSWVNFLRRKMIIKKYFLNMVYFKFYPAYH